MGYVYPGVEVDLGGGRGWLDGAAAASIRRIDAALGHMLQITEAGRSFFQQNEHWLKYLRDGYPIALNPDTPSEHQKGQAIDSDEAQNFVEFMQDHGWYRTVYRWVNGKWTLVERWHFEYFYDRDNHRNESASGGGAAKRKVNKHMQSYRCKDVDGNGNPGVALLNDTAPIGRDSQTGRENPVLMLDAWSGSTEQVRKWEQLFDTVTKTVDRDGLEVAMKVVEMQHGSFGWN